jgi:hypothetical protein
MLLSVLVSFGNHFCYITVLDNCIIFIIEQFWTILLRQTSTLIRRDFIWSRICERIVTGVPDRCMESVLVPLVKLLPW